MDSVLFLEGMLLDRGSVEDMLGIPSASVHYLFGKQTSNQLQLLIVVLSQTMVIELYASIAPGLFSYLKRYPSLTPITIIFCLIIFLGFF
jgi:hypothetical protein